ncbi:MAG: integrase core domain-containing protein, partial [Planctomycetota bacterium]
IKKECIRPNCPGNLEEAMKQISAYMVHYNTVRLHSAIGYVTPADRLSGLDKEITAERDRKLEEARLRRRLKAAKDQLAIAS